MRLTTSLLLAAALSLAACDNGPSCVVDLDTACSPLVDPPTFQAIFDGTLNPTCASGSGTCHTANAAKGGLVFEDPDTSYALLLGTADGRARVLPGDPSCSLIVERLSSTDRNFRMPPGPTPLSPAEICTVVRWIQNGAAR